MLYKSRFAWTRAICFGTAGLLAVLIGILDGCKSVPTNEELRFQDSLKGAELYPFLPPKPNRKPLPISVPYPVILIHGMGQKAWAWSGEGSRYFRENLKMTFGGVLSVKSGKVNSSVNIPGDFYIVQVSDSTAGMELWVRELEQFIRYVKTSTSAPSVILVGYSMGGVCARIYCTRHRSDHGVRRLVTIGSPHQGSVFAQTWKWKSGILRAYRRDPGILERSILAGALKLFESVEEGVPADAPCVRDLMRPEDGGAYLDSLSRVEHPTDIDYISIVGNIDFWQSMKKLQASTVSRELFRKAIEIAGGSFNDIWSEAGDGVVSYRSQDMASLAAFQSKPNGVYSLRSARISSSHQMEIQHSDSAQIISMSNMPTILDISFVRDGSIPKVVVIYEDLAPKLSTVSTKILWRNLQWNLDSMKKVIVPIDGKRTVIEVEGELPKEFDFQSNAQVIVEVTNSFGKKGVLSREWLETQRWGK